MTDWTSQIRGAMPRIRAALVDAAMGRHLLLIPPSLNT